MKVIGEFSEDSQHESLHADGRDYVATWETNPGYVEIPGISEVKVRIHDAAGHAVLYMRWLLANIATAGGKEGLLEALASHSSMGDGWANCLREDCENCPPAIIESGAIALLALIVSPPAFQGLGLGTPLARAFAETVLTRFGVKAFWIEPIPLMEHAATGVFKPKHALDTHTFDAARARLEKHYEQSLDAKWTCPNYLRVDLNPDGTT